MNNIIFDLLIILSIVALLAFINGLFKPKWVIHWGHTDKRNRKRVLAFYGSALLVLPILALAAVTSWFFIVFILMLIVLIIVFVIMLVGIFLTPPLFILGMIKPKLSMWWRKKKITTRKHVSIFYGAAFVLSITITVIIGTTGVMDALETTPLDDDEDVMLSTYTGERNSDGEKHGYGTVANNTSFYKGNWENNQRSGQGEQLIKFGHLVEIHYTGEWENNLPNGYGEQTVKFLWITVHYEGEFKNDMRHGQGTFVDRSGNIYEGEWKNDQPNGFGESTLTNGEYYIGEWKNWQRHGEGKLMKNDKIIHQGTFIEDKY